MNERDRDSTRRRANSPQPTNDEEWAEQRGLDRESRE